MTARKLHGSWWVDFRHRFERHRYKSPDDSRAGALAFEATLRGRLARGEPVFPAAPTECIRFRDFTLRWLAVYVEPNNKFSEIRTKTVILSRHLVPHFGALPLNEIGTEQIEQYAATKVQSGLAKKTVNNHLVVLQRALKSAWEWKLIPSPPRARLLKTDPPTTHSLSEDETALLLADHHEPLIHDMVVLALNTGMRRGELMALDWSDVDFERRRVTVRRALVLDRLVTPKSNRVRYIPLPHEALSMLERRMQRPGFVFTKPDGNPLSREMMDDGIRRLRRRTCLQRLGWHMLRHTYASDLASQNISLEKVRELLGHSSIMTTMRYLHLAPRVGDEAVAVLEKRNQRVFAARGQPVGNTPTGSWTSQRPQPNDSPLNHNENTPRVGVLQDVGRLGIETGDEIMTKRPD